LDLNLYAHQDFIFQLLIHLVLLYVPIKLSTLSFFIFSILIISPHQVFFIIFPSSLFFYFDFPSLCSNWFLACGNLLTKIWSLFVSHFKFVEAYHNFSMNPFEVPWLLIRYLNIMHLKVTCCDTWMKTLLFVVIFEHRLGGWCSILFVQVCVMFFNVHHWAMNSKFNAFQILFIVNCMP
jgi:hypothetical protein